MASITTLLTTNPISLDPTEARIEISLLTSLLTFTHPRTLKLATIEAALLDAGFEVLSDEDHAPLAPIAIRSAGKWWATKAARERRETDAREEEKRMGEAHLLACRACREGLEPTRKGKGVDCVVTMNGDQVAEKITTLLVGGMTCTSCLSSITSILSPQTDARIKDARVTLLPGQAVVRHEAGMTADELKVMIEDGGFEADVLESKDVVEVESGWVETRLLIDGMTCS